MPSRVDCSTVAAMLTLGAAATHGELTLSIYAHPQATMTEGLTEAAD